MSQLNETLSHKRMRALHMYFAHTQRGESFRDIGQKFGVNPSTVLRHVRKVEEHRDDPLVDDAILKLSCDERNLFHQKKDIQSMTFATKTPRIATRLNKAELRALRRLSETGAFMAVGQNIANAVIFRECAHGDPIKTAMIPKDMAQTLVMRDLIRLSNTTGELSRYRISDTGVAALKRALATEGQDQGFSEQHREWGERCISNDEGKPTKIRVNLKESPLAMLSRKKDKSGSVFLAPELVDAGERLREDFELAQMGPRITQNWDRFINGGDRGVFQSAGEGGSAAAQRRLAEALSALGAGLGDITLRCCCYLEGLEAAEKRMGWSARSGKIVLRIALQRLRLHYDGALSEADHMIG